MIEIYYMEDDKNIGQTVKEYLERKGCAVSLFSTVADTKSALAKHVPQMILADINMPDGSGEELCLWIRARWRELPIIYLTVKSDTGDIVRGFQNGADDYVVKPFELEVLYSRILALLRRTGTAAQQLSCGPIVLDRIGMKVFREGDEVVLSQAEYQLLLMLMENKGRTITRERLLEQIWDNSGNYVNDNTLTVTMKRLREKLGRPTCLKTIRSFGYRMEEG